MFPETYMTPAKTRHEMPHFQRNSGNVTFKESGRIDMNNKFLEDKIAQFLPFQDIHSATLIQIRLSAFRPMA